MSIDSHRIEVPGLLAQVAQQQAAMGSYKAQRADVERQVIGMNNPPSTQPTAPPMAKVQSPAQAPAQFPDQAPPPSYEAAAMYHTTTPSGNFGTSSSFDSQTQRFG